MQQAAGDLKFRPLEIAQVFGLEHRTPGVAKLTLVHAVQDQGYMNQ